MLPLVLTLSTISGQNVLHKACIGGHTAVVTFLVGSRCLGVFDVENGTTSGVRPIHMAAQGGFHELVQLLLDHGASPNAITTTKQSALHKAAYEGYDQVVDILVRAGADINACDQEGHTVLMHCAAGWCPMKCCGRRRC